MRIGFQDKRGNGSIGRVLLALFLLLPLILISGWLSALPQVGNSKSSVYPPSNLTRPVTTGFNLSGIQVYYSQALAAASETLNATGVISTFPLRIVPSQYQSIMNSTDDMIQNLANQLRVSGSDYQLGLTSAQFGDFIDASTQLAAARSDALSANDTFNSLQASFGAIKAAGIPIGQVEPGMNALHGQVSALLSDISGEATLVQRVESGLLAAANLTLSATPATVKIGENLTASGTLKSKGLALDNQSISILYQGRMIGIATTDSAGRYRLGFTAPANYTSVANITASFDSPEYAPVKAIAFVGVSFYTTIVNLTSVPSLVVPGQSYNLPVNITIVPSGAAAFPAPKETIQAYLLGQKSNITVSGNSLQLFSMQFAATETTPNGPNVLVFNSTGSKEYAPLSFATQVQVRREPISVSVSSPSEVNPLKSFTVSGKAEVGLRGNQTPLSSGIVKVNFGGKVVQQNLRSDGTFSLTLGPNLNTAITGGKLSITIVPGVSSVNAYSANLTVNGLETSPGASSAIILVIAFVFAALYFALFRRSKGNKSRSSVFTPEKATASSSVPNQIVVRYS
jgi:hypothetical protein